MKFLVFLSIVFYLEKHRVTHQLESVKIFAILNQRKFVSKKNKHTLFFIFSSPHHLQSLISFTFPSPTHHLPFLLNFVKITNFAVCAPFSKFCARMAVLFASIEIYRCMAHLTLHKIIRQDHHHPRVRRHRI